VSRGHGRGGACAVQGGMCTPTHARRVPGCAARTARQARQAHPPTSR
jgi:hypothetical protein